jgi:hypothetical protein
MREKLWHSPHHGCVILLKDRFGQTATRPLEKYVAHVLYRKASLVKKRPDIFRAKRHES